MTRADADKALKALEHLDGPTEFLDVVGRFIYDVRDQLPKPHRPFAQREAQEAYDEVQAAAERGAGPDSHKTIGR